MKGHRTYLDLMPTARPARILELKRGHRTFTHPVQPKESQLDVAA
jgi:hypothetical protein